MILEYWICCYEVSYNAIQCKNTMAYVTRKEYGKMRVENKIKCYCVCHRLYLAIKIYSKELNKLLFGSGLIKTNGCLGYD